MTSVELSFLDHCVAASDILKTAATEAELSTQAYDAITDLRHGGELLFQAAFSIIDRGSETDPAAAEQCQWALLKVLEVLASQPGANLETLKRWVASAERKEAAKDVSGAEK
jgi:hypothetical protein